MNDDSSWIDDIIQQHKKQLDNLKNKKNTIDDNIDILSDENFKSNNHLNQIGKISKNFKNLDVEPSQKFKTINQFNNEKSSFNKNINPNVFITKEINNLKINNNEEELKEEIKKLKEENESLKIENETLKKYLEENNNSKINNNNVDIEKYKNIIDQLNSQLNKIEEEKENNEKKIKQLESIKNQEVDLLNQKIKNFEIIIDENSNNYINENKMLKIQIKNNELELEECGKYIEIVNIFINKIDFLFGIQSKKILNIQELQNKFIEIEKLIQNILNNNNIHKISKLENNNVKEDFNSKSEKDINESVEKEENKNDENLKVPHFQNEILEQGVGNYQINNLTSNREDKYQIFKNLEQRIIDLEKKLYQNPNQENKNHKMKKYNNNNKNIVNINSGITYINNNENKSNSKNKVLRSKSSGKINNEKLPSNQLTFKSSNSNQINYNHSKKGKKIKKIQRKKSSKSNYETSTYISNQNNINNDNYSISNYSTYSNLKNN